MTRSRVTRHLDDCRRVHNYDEFITTFLTMLAEQNLLGDLVQHGLGSKRLAAADREASTVAATATASGSGNMKKHSGAISKNTSTQAITLPSQAGSSGSSVSQPLRNRKKKKKKYEESESDWSDEEALVPVNRGGLYRTVIRILFGFISGPNPGVQEVLPSYLKLKLHSLFNFNFTFLHLIFLKEK
jgi:hypothetical protein